MLEEKAYKRAFGVFQRAAPHASLRYGEDGIAKHTFSELHHGIQQHHHHTEPLTHSASMAEQLAAAEVCSKARPCVGSEREHERRVRQYSRDHRDWRQADFDQFLIDMDAIVQLNAEEKGKARRTYNIDWKDGDARWLYISRKDALGM